MRPFTAAAIPGYASHITGFPVIGIGLSDESGEEPQATRNAAFLRLAMPLMGGPDGEPQGSPVRFPGRPTRSVPPTRLVSGVRFNHLNESEHTMNETHQGASAPDRRTSYHEFFKANQRDELFSVRENVSADDAMQMASCFIGSAARILMQVADAGNYEDQQALYGALYLVEMAEGVVDAAVLGLAKEKSHV